MGYGVEGVEGGVWGVGCGVWGVGFRDQFGAWNEKVRPGEGSGEEARQRGIAGYELLHVRERATEGRLLGVKNGS